MKRKKGAFDIEDVFAYLAFVAMVIFFIILLKIRSAAGIPFIGESPDKRVLDSNSVAIIESNQKLNFMNFLKQTVEINGENMSMAELMSRYYYEDKFMDVSDDIKEIQKKKLEEKLEEAYLKQCISIKLKDKGEGSEIEFKTDACKCVPEIVAGAEEYFTNFNVALPSEYGNGLNWLKISIKEFKISCEELS